MATIQIYKNKTKDLSFVIQPKENEKYYDLTGATGLIKVQLSIPGQDDAVVISKALTIDDAEQGKCSVTLENSDTDINVAIYSYTLEFNFSIGDDRILQSGLFEILGDDITTIETIKQKYEFSYDNYTMQNALDYAREQILSNAFMKQETTFSKKDNIIKILNYVADMNFDDTVDASDISLIEYQQKTPYTVNDLSSNISSVNFDHPNGYTIITMDDEYPSDSTYKLKLVYYQIYKKYADLKKKIRYIEELYVIEHLFKTLEIYKLQHGMTNKTLNGVTIEFNKQAIDDFLKQLKSWIGNEIMKVRPLKGAFKPVTIPKTY